MLRVSVCLGGEQCAPLVCSYLDSEGAMAVGRTVTALWYRNVDERSGRMKVIKEEKGRRREKKKKEAEVVAEKTEA